MRTSKNSLRKKIILRRRLFWLYMPVMIFVQYLFQQAGAQNMLMLPFALLYFALLGSVHISIIFSKCPFCNREFWGADRPDFSRGLGFKTVLVSGSVCPHCGTDLVKPEK